jgi:hypothetical protein
MANSKSENNKSNYLGDYAAKHPRRMYSGMLALGTMIGAGMMAAKGRRDRDNDPIHKLLDKLNRD